MTKRLLLALLLLAAAGACGDDGGEGNSDLTGDEQVYVDEAMEDFDPGDAEMSEDDARCMVTAMVDEVGVERLEEIGLSAESFSEDEDLPSNVGEADAQKLVDSMTGCIDLRALFLEGMAQDEDIPAEAQECLADQFDEELVERVMVVMMAEGEEALMEDPELSSAMLRAFSECPGAVG